MPAFSFHRSALVHFGFAILALCAAVWLITTTQGPLTAQVGALVYGTTLAGLYWATSIYEFTRYGAWSGLWQKIDHSAIFLFIAGCYTPVCLMKLSGWLQPTLLVSVWCLAALGVALKLRSADTHRGLSTSLYVLLGWLSLVAVKPLFLALPLVGFLAMLLGGILYTVGAFIYATKSCELMPGYFGHHEVWHVLVLLASSSHFFAISRYIL